MKNKKGFTLVELLTIIVILAVIMVIGVPMVLNTISDATSATWKNTVNSIKKGILNGIQALDPDTTEYKYTVSGLCKNPSKLSELAKMENTNVTCSDNTFVLVGNGKFKGKKAKIICTDRTCTVEIIEDTSLAAGLYDSNNKLIASWDKLVNDYGMILDWYYYGWDHPEYNDEAWDGMWYVDSYDLERIYQDPERCPDDYPEDPCHTITEVGWYRYKYVEVEQDDGSIYQETVGYEKIDPLTTKIQTHSAGLIFASHKELAKGTKLVIPDEGMQKDTDYYWDDDLDDYVEFEVDTIPFMAFANCINLETIVIKEGVYWLGDSAFNNCVNLKNVELPETVARMDFAFTNCHSLETIKLPNSLKSIGEATFFRNYSLKEVNIPEGVTYISGRVFEEATALEKVTIPSTVHELDAIFTLNNYGSSDCLNMNCFHPPQVVFNDPKNWYVTEKVDPSCTKSCEYYRNYFSTEDMSNPYRAAEILSEHYWIQQDTYR